MTASGIKKQPGLVISTRKSQYRIGPKWLVAALVAVAIVVLGIAASPSNGWVGVGIGLSGVLGAIFGLLIQPVQVPKDWGLEATSAVRGLLDAADSIDSVVRLTSQLSASSESERVSIGLVTAQDELLAIREKLYRSMVDWDAVAPEATNEVKRLNDAGMEAFNRLRSQTNV